MEVYTCKCFHLFSQSMSFDPFTFKAIMNMYDHILNSLNFCLSWKLVTVPSNLKESLAGYSILGRRFFPFITLNVWCLSFLAWRVSVEKSAESPMGVPLYVICCFNILSLSLFSVSLITMCLGMYLNQRESLLSQKVDSCEALLTHTFTGGNR